MGLRMLKGALPPASPRPRIKCNKIIQSIVHRRSFLTAYKINVLLNLLNEFRKKITCEALPSILPFFRKEFNKFNNI